MTVIIKPKSVPMMPAGILFKKAFVEQVARELLASQAEALLEMAVDFNEEYNTFEEFRDLIEGPAMAPGGVHDTTLDSLDDVLAEFRELLTQAITETKVKLINVTTDKDGLSDAVIEIGE